MMLEILRMTPSMVFSYVVTIINLDCRAALSSNDDDVSIITVMSHTEFGRLIINKQQ